MSDRLRVLLVEDSPTDARLLVRELEDGGFDVESARVQTADDLRRQVESRAWDLVIADCRLPAFDGPAALALLRSLDSDLPCILVSGAIGEDAAVDALLAGAQDFVMKDRLARLVPAVHRSLREAEGRRRQRALENRLRESQQQLQSILDHSPTLVHVSDVRGRLLLTNHVFDAKFGGGADTLLGKTAREIFPARTAELREAHDRAALAQDGPLALEETYDEPDGTHTYLAVSFPLRDTQGEVYAVCTIATDVTEQKRTEAHLLQAQKMESFGQLAAGVAHDFNNILCAMIMTINLVQLQKGLPAEAASALGDLERTARRAAALTRQLLLFSRGHVMESQTFDLNELVNGLVEMLRRLIPENVRIVVTPHDRPVWVRADHGMIEQVLTNLAVNARDAMRDGGDLEIAVRQFEREALPPDAARGRDAGLFGCLAVRDTGCGMDEATRRRIFEPFFTTKPIGQGTGLGLAAAYGIVRQHHGWIDVDTAVGRGTEFRVFLPALPVGAPVVAAPPVALDTGTESILLVEDDAHVRGAIGRLLRRCGYAVTEAESGIAALALCQPTRAAFDMLITDIVMPGGVSGTTLAQELRRLNPALRVIVVSGYRPEIAGGAASGFVFDAQLQKPVAADVFLATIRRVLGTPAGPALPRPSLP